MGKASHDIGWIGLGRMGEAMAARLVKAGHGLSVWNRTASKADPLAQIGAEVVTDKAAMAHCATVFTMVSTTDDLKEILFGAGGVLAGKARPKRVVDMSSISDTGSAEIRKGLTEAGVAYLSAPVSGNAKVAKAGKLLVVASGPEGRVRRGAAAAGRAGTLGDVCRRGRALAHLEDRPQHHVRRDHPVAVRDHAAGREGRHPAPRLPGIDQSERAGLDVHASYKTPALVNLDFTTTFTPKLLLKDMELGMGAAKAFGVTMPTASVTRDSIAVAGAPVSRRHRLLRAAARAGARRRHEARAGEREGGRWAAVTPSGARDLQAAGCMIMSGETPARSATEPMTKLLLKSGIVVTQDPKLGVLPTGDVLVEDGRIAAIAPSLAGRRRDDRLQPGTSCCRA